MEQRVVCAAIRRDKGGLVICSARHFDEQMRRQIEATESSGWETAEQGFIDQRGKFLTREEAFVVAAHARQIINRCGGDSGKLFSENLY